MDYCKEAITPIATNCLMDANEAENKFIQPNIED